MPADTATQLLDAAQARMQEKGYNAFSYSDLAEAVGIRKASIHYHFPTKGNLALSVMERYNAALGITLSAIEKQKATPKARIHELIKIYSKAESQGSICLCGSLASDFETLPESVKIAVSTYIQTSEDWVTKEIKAGIQTGQFAFKGSPKEASVALIASLQGGLILSRPRRGPVIKSIQRTFMLSLLDG